MVVLQEGRMRRLRTMSAVKFGRRPVCRRVGSAPIVSSHNRNHSGCSPVMNVRILRETRHGKNIAIIAAYSSMATMHVKKHYSRMPRSSSVRAGQNSALGQRKLSLSR